MQWINNIITLFIYEYHISLGKSSYKASVEKS